jgi:hypothetical protein
MNKNTEFNLYCAKRGMAVIVCWDDGEAMYFLSRRENTFENVNTDFDDFFELDDLPSNPMRMATRAECEAAGVEYIEPPVSAEELAELRKDSERLYFILARCEVVFNGTGFETLSQLDAAMKGGE